MSANKPLISVIIPVYKVEKYLPQSVESAINQSYKNLEIILIDDGSPDNSGKLCDEYALLDPRVKVVHKPNGGQSSARNVGLDIATGDFIAFLDSDDYIDRNMYSDLIEHFDDDVSIIESNVERVTKDGECIKDVEIYARKNYTEKTLLSTDEYLKALLINETVWTLPTNKLYRRSVIGDIRFIPGILNEDLVFLYEIEKRLALDGKDFVHKYLPMTHLHYRQTPGSTTENPDSKMIVDEYENLRAISEDPFLSHKPYLEDLRHKRLMFLLHVNSKVLASKKLTEKYHKKYNDEIRLHKISEFTAGLKGKEYLQVYLFATALKYFPHLFAKLRTK